MSLSRHGKSKKNIIGEYDLSQYFVVVDGFSSGRYIAPKLLGNGYNGIIHVLSKAAKEVGYKLRPDQEKNYIACLEEGEDIKDLLSDLSDYLIRAIIPGAHAGVMLADQLNKAFNLPMSNDFDKTIVRLDKYLMQEEIRKHSIPAPKQCLVGDIKTLLAWVEENRLPIVLKPLQSSGTDGVYFCNTLEEVNLAFNNLMQNKTVYGQANNQIVAQEMLQGKEYMVNTVSCRDPLSGEDCVHITDILLVKKKQVNGAPLYDYAMNLSRNDKQFKEITDYVARVLPALGLHYGASHTEVIVTDQGPKLVEVNPRLMGTYDMSALTEATGTNQVEQLVQIYIHDGYLQQLNNQPNIDSKFTLASFLMTEKSGHIEQKPNVDIFKKIPGFHSIKLLCEKGKKLLPTSQSPVVNLPGVVNFVAKSPDLLLEAHAELRKVEDQFYENMMTKKQKSSLAMHGLHAINSSPLITKITDIISTPSYKN